jgi:hypothetical protein
VEAPAGARVVVDSLSPPHDTTKNTATVAAAANLFIRGRLEARADF